MYNYIIKHAYNTLFAMVSRSFSRPYLPIQRRNRKKKEKERREVKLAVTYEGWKKEAEPDRYHVVNKRFVAGVADM